MESWRRGWRGGLDLGRWTVQDPHINGGFQAGVSVWDDTDAATSEQDAQTMRSRN